MRAVRLIGNWLIIITSPIWILPAGLISIGSGLVKKNDDCRDSMVCGKQWIWE